MRHSMGETETSIGHYKLLAELGRGGYATVYRALDTSLRREVALKVLHPMLLNDAGLAQRFFREAQALAALRHPGILTVYEVNEADGRLYIAMELANGLSLDKRIAEQGALGWGETLRLTRPVCEVLAYVHTQGIVHRDLKPSNILLDQARGPLLSDFGLARLMSVGSSSLSLSLGGGQSVLGTPPYIAPELWDLESADPPADIYSLGCIVYEMLTGQALFSGPTPLQVMRAHDRGPQFPAQWPEGVPGGIATLLGKALAHEPRERFADAREVWAALEKLDREQRENGKEGTREKEEAVRQESLRRLALEQAAKLEAVRQEADRQEAERLEAERRELENKKARHTEELEIPPDSGAGDAGKVAGNTESAVAGAADSGTKGGKKVSRRQFVLYAVVGGAVVVAGTALIAKFASQQTAQPEVSPTDTPLPTATQLLEIPTATPPPAPPPAPVSGAGRKVCQVTDTGGIDDKSFNATAWKGFTDARDTWSVDAKYLESRQQTDYARNISAFLEEKCDLIVTVGFLLGDDTKAAAEKNPNQKFAIVDFEFDPPLPNVLGLIFATNQASFLAGYLAAGMTKTGKVGTFGGMQIPTVTIFMDGYTSGVQYYNQQNNAQVSVLGWNTTAQSGSFSGDFSNTDNGKSIAQNLMDEGADIIMPVAGPVGLGAAQAVRNAKNAWIIGVDTDWTVSAVSYQDIVLTSVMKNSDAAVYAAVQAVLDGSFQGGIYTGTLANGGVGLGPIASAVPESLKASLDQVKADIIAGKINPRAR
jgi:basic membrane protein A and related proteins